MTDDATFLTPAAYQKMQDELEQLKTAGRREIEERIAEARSHGDLRENADYDAAKNDQGLMEARIRQLEAVLAHAQVEEPSDDGTVQIGSVVTVTDDEGDDVEYFVATPENREPGFLLASPAGPLGQALLGARVGERVEYEAPGGKFSLTIKQVRAFGS